MPHDNKFSIEITNNAYEKIINVISKKETKHYFRINVTTGGCAGFTISFDITPDKDEDDIVIKHNNIDVIINKEISEIIGPVSLDYKSDLLSSYFQMTVKNSSKSCSCGSSFGI